MNKKNDNQAESEEKQKKKEERVCASDTQQCVDDCDGQSLDEECEILPCPPQTAFCLSALITQPTLTRMPSNMH